MTKKIIDNPPEQESQEQAIEILLWLAKGATIPTIIGPWLIDIADKLFKRPHQNRTNEWMQQVANAINDLVTKQEEMTIPKLAENNEFVTVLHKASELAVRTHQAEKRKLLKNAIVSAGSPHPPELDKQMFFMRLIDELSINQVLVLLLFSDPHGWFKRHDKTPHQYGMASRMSVLRDAYPELANDPLYKDLVLGEIERRGLISNLYGMMSGDSVFNPATSTLGIQFLEYIRAETIEK